MIGFPAHSHLLSLPALAFFIIASCGMVKAGEQAPYQLASLPGEEAMVWEVSQPIPLPTPRPERTIREEPVRKRLHSAKLTDDEQACRRQLNDLDVAFTALPPITSDKGCGIAHPVMIRSLSEDITIAPEAILNCQTALALSKFFNGPANIAAERHFGQKITTVLHASAYVCRPRNGTAKLSEHAFGNAFDIVSIMFSGNETLTVKAYDNAESREAKFMSETRAAACGPFKTVLGPGTDADHADHFHFDMKARRNGGTYCK